jgi:hypothetical protein
MKYTHPDLRSLKFIQRPRGTIPSTIKKEEKLNIECAFSTKPEKIKVTLFGGGQEWELPVILLMPKFGNVEAQKDQSLLLSAQIPGNLPELLYSLKIRLGDCEDIAPRAIKVVSEYKKNYRFIHITDLHIQSSKDDRLHDEKLIAIAQEIVRLAPEFVIMTGDITDSGSRPEYLRFLLALQAFQVPTFVIPGNHDHYFWRTKYSYFGFDEYDKYIGPRFFSFTYGEDRFIGVDSGDYEKIYEDNLDGIHKSQWPWLITELEEGKNRAGGLLCVFAHYDYTEILPEFYGFRGQLINLFNTYPVKLYIYGHGHKNFDKYYENKLTLFLETASTIDGYYRLIEIKNSEVTAYPVYELGKGKKEEGENQNISTRR